ncbi:hypothetical protein SAMN04487829_1474 [Pseudobutyrivibrio sp. NOR37]|uniref:Class I SAM-dependent methyltransferase n=1 Tax=Pseudobutyrivibrio xylanivorans TaxID=185007 RepID=A0A6M0LIY6_PSEXY|nr:MULTISPECIES: hypothetical protein [Pseudobutyrivibrio]NEX01867.1 hypothetical protein [Pseudobutyrivibrio xylanivorans]SFR72377.1 hypothetical protein SAMN04487829_1474 [Pseudobutyrivibrio sp. NOR37]
MDYIDYIRTWLSGIDDEISFWENEVFNEQGQFHNKIITRYIKDRKFKLEDDLEDYDECSFLDVGAGPFSRCGFESEKVKINAIAVDPLADVYRRLMEKYNLTNGIQLRTGLVEFLDELFDEETFDIVHMSNSLDHSFDPILGIYQLLYVCKIGGKVILRHHENEAENEEYEGFHQWNLSVHNQENSFMVWRENIRHNVNKLFAEYADITIYPDQKENESNWFYNKVVLTKKKTIEVPKNEYFKIFSKVIYSHFLNYSYDREQEALLYGRKNNFAKLVKDKIALLRNKAIILTNKTPYKKIDIYGVGGIGRDLYILLTEIGITVDKIIDKQDKHIGLLPIVTMANYVFEKEKDLIVITLDKDYEIIKRQLINKGVNEKKIIKVDQFLESF